MYELNYTESEALTCLRTFQSVIEKGPAENLIGKEFIETVQRQFFKTSFRLDNLESMPVQHLPKSLTNELVRKALSKFLVILALCDTKIHLPQIHFIKSVDNILNTREHSIKNLYQAYYHQFRRLRHDIRLRAFGRTKENIDKVSLKAKMNSIKAELRLFLGFQSHNHINESLLKKIKALERLAIGTLGRGYIEYLEHNKFPYPGDDNSAAEFIIPHDLTHVLTGYDTTPIEEVQVLFFTAGYQQQDPMSKILFAMFLFHCNIPVGLIADSFYGSFKPELALKAYRLGLNMNIDLENKWDYWSVMSENVDSLRKKYNINRPENVKHKESMYA